MTATWSNVRRAAEVALHEAMVARDLDGVELARGLLAQSSAATDMVVAAIFDAPKELPARLVPIAEAGAGISDERVQAARAYISQQQERKRQRRQAPARQRPLVAPSTPDRERVVEILRAAGGSMSMAEARKAVEGAGLPAMVVGAMVRDGQLRQGRGNLVEIY